MISTDTTLACDLVTRLMNEGVIGMSAAAKRLGTFRGGKPCHPATPTRWAKNGVPLSDGSQLYLESITLPGDRLVTSWPAVIRFVQAMQGRQAAKPAPIASAHSAKARQRVERAGRELEKAGM